MPENPATASSIAATCAGSLQLHAAAGHGHAHGCALVLVVLSVRPVQGHCYSRSSGRSSPCAWASAHSAGGTSSSTCAMFLSTSATLRIPTCPPHSRTVQSCQSCESATASAGAPRASRRTWAAPRTPEPPPPGSPRAYPPVPATPRPAPRAPASGRKSARRWCRRRFRQGGRRCRAPRRRTSPRARPG